MAGASATESTRRPCERQTPSPTWRHRIPTRPPRAGSWSPPSSRTSWPFSNKPAWRAAEQPEARGSSSGIYPAPTPPPGKGRRKRAPHDLHTLHCRQLDTVAMSEPVTTAGVIAVGNLEARIDGQVSRATAGKPTVGERAELVELLTLRGHVLGRIADAERAAALADKLV